MKAGFLPRPLLALLALAPSPALPAAVPVGPFTVSDDPAAIAAGPYAGPVVVRDLTARAPVVNINAPQATITGATNSILGTGLGATIESFKGIPFAMPPTGNLRLKPPVRITQPLGNVDATTSSPNACPQFLLNSDTSILGLPPTTVQAVLQNPLLKTVGLVGQEDCLNINVQRPVGTKAGDNLPVVLWIFGGGFELGATAMYDGANVVGRSIMQGKPIVFVAVNYRVGGFGFLGGKEILADGSSNLGLLDQRMGMEWVADNIAAFGGDPDKVTLWGESAGAISIFDQILLYDGDNTYKGKPLFRAAIMNSGSAIPTDPVDCPKAQAVYDMVVERCGCKGQKDTLNCLRQADYQTLLNATNSVPGILSYNSVALSYIPRPDNKTLVASPERVAATGKFAKVPFIIGDQEDEGTLFALFQSNITTTDQIESYLQQLYFTNTDPAIIKSLVATYPDDPTAGSPFGSGTSNNWYPQYKRIAALLGDATFTLSRRAVLNISTALSPTVKRWSYLSSYDMGTPIMGTFHGSDLLQTFYGILPNYAASATLAYNFNFAYNLDPNDGSGGTRAALGAVPTLPNWPVWNEGQMLMNFRANDAGVIKDDFRQESADFILQNALNLHF